MQLRTPQVREIDGYNYEVTPLGAIRGSQVFVRLLKVIGPVISSKDMSALFENLSEEDMNFFVERFSPSTLVVGNGMLDKIFDIHFAGRMMSMLKWLFFCLQVNYADFFAKGTSGLAGAMGLGTDQAPSASTSLPAQTGPSGAS